MEAGIEFGLLLQTAHKASKKYLSVPEAVCPVCAASHGAGVIKHLLFLGGINIIIGDL